MIQDLEDYKLQAQAKKIATGEIQVTIQRWVKDHGWARLELYLDPQSYQQFITSLTLDTK